MPADSSPKSKPTTRSSLRQSLNLASVGKAFADVMSKDGREASKNAKKTKEASRRSSALSTLPSGPRASMGDVRPPSQVSKRTSTPDSKTLTRRRVSASYQRSSSDEQSSKTAEPTSPQQPPTQARSSTLRPKNLNATSALPKYRPKSAVLEAAKPPSPVRAGTRRRLSTSDDEKKEQNRPVGSVASPAEKNSRPISPLPHRAALKANLTNSRNVSPPSTPPKVKISTPSSLKASSSPARPAKIVKTAASTAIPRPPSSSSSSLSLQHTPKSAGPKTSTPKTSGLKAKLGLSPSGKTAGASVTPSNGPPSPPSRDSPSPLARHSRKNSKMMTPASASAMVGNMSHISEGASEEEDDDDVALLLAPVAAMGAPTPAMPRIQINRKRVMPHTPTRPGLPGRADMSYLSPLPPGSDGKNNSSSSSLRPPQRQTAIEKATRGSLFSFDHLANELSVTLGEDEFGRMLSDVPAPFHSRAASPSLSSQMGGMSIPESPLLSAIDSPGAYGSISQVLLPDVTPSPAMHNILLQQSRFSLSPDAALLESSSSASATMLRLQLAAAEAAAHDRLGQVQAMEEEMQHLRLAHAHEREETQKQVAYMEAQWRAGDERAAYAADLEARLRQAHVSREQAVEDAVARVWEEAKRAHAMQLKAEGLRCEMGASARLAASGWGAVRDACEVELDVVRSDRGVLSLLLAQLDQLAHAL
ncbi:hypothetical protein BDZ97DRAFT_1786702 [Flammula alnicola]|nr:hypothetical protein BDZ97DRAFT_1786702 [Flammula alnicola]